MTACLIAPFSDILSRDNLSQLQPIPGSEQQNRPASTVVGRARPLGQFHSPAFFERKPIGSRHRGSVEKSRKGRDDVALTFRSASLAKRQNCRPEGRLYKLHSVAHTTRALTPANDHVCLTFHDGADKFIFTGITLFAVVLRINKWGRNNSYLTNLTISMRPEGGDAGTGLLNPGKSKNEKQGVLR